MKHNIKINLILVVIFLLAQFTGLFVVNHYIDHKATAESNSIQWQPLPYEIERPEIENQSTSFIYIMVAILIGTLLFLFMAKLNKPSIWKIWFFTTLWITLSFSFNSFTNEIAAGIIALLFAIVRIFKPNVIIHNISEIFIYGGLAAIFVPVMNVFAAFMLLIAISVYDMIAVWKTKHMIKLAEFQTKSLSFAGIFIPYKLSKKNIKAAAKNIKSSNKISKSTEKSGENSLHNSTAILGGGDIGFPLIFAGVVMKSLMLQKTVLEGFLLASIIPVFSAAALFILLSKGQKNKFYPAMPFISAGCFAGYLVMMMFV